MSKRDEDLMKVGDQVGQGLGRLWTIVVYGVLAAILFVFAGAVVLGVMLVKSC